MYLPLLKWALADRQRVRGQHTEHIWPWLRYSAIQKDREIPVFSILPVFCG